MQYTQILCEIVHFNFLELNEIYCKYIYELHFSSTILDDFYLFVFQSVAVVHSGIVLPASDTCNTGISFTHLLKESNTFIQQKRQ